MVKISVAMCTYNGEKYIKEQLDSILRQTLPIDELVIGDDNSNDDTIKLIEEITNNIDIDVNILINKQNLGFKKNFYNTISRCQGDIIFFCDQDDVWEEQKVEKMIEVFNCNPHALLVFSNAYVTDQNLHTISNLFDSLFYQSSYMRDSKTQYKHLLADNFVTGATTAIKKELLNKSNPIPMDVAHDYWFAIVAALNGGLVSLEIPLIKYRQHMSNTIGIKRGINFNDVKKLFSKKNETNNTENQYAELRIPLILHLKRYLVENDFDTQYIEITNDFYQFWKKREKFPYSGILKNIFIVTKDIIVNEQHKHRNTNKAIIKDYVKAIALARRDR